MRRLKVAVENRPTTRNLRPIVRLLKFVRPYRIQLLAAVVALIIAAMIAEHTGLDLLYDALLSCFF
jgi:hypothetical protein